MKTHFWIIIMKNTAHILINEMGYTNIFYIAAKKFEDLTIILVIKRN